MYYADPTTASAYGVITSSAEPEPEPEAEPEPEMDYSPSYWAKIGRTFFSGENKSGDFVTDAEYTDCVSMNNDGTIIALGSGITTAGLISRVRVFEWNTTSNDWTQKVHHLSDRVHSYLEQK